MGLNVPRIAPGVVSFQKKMENCRIQVIFAYRQNCTNYVAPNRAVQNHFELSEKMKYANDVSKLHHFRNQFV